MTGQRYADGIDYGDPNAPGVLHEAAGGGHLYVMQGNHECKQYACGIQDCLSRNNYQQRKCAKEIQQLVSCCRRLEAPNVHCLGFGIPYDAQPQPQPQDSFMPDDTQLKPQESVPAAELELPEKPLQ